MSKSYRSEAETKSKRFFTAQEEYDRGLRRRPKTLKHEEELDDDNFEIEEKETEE